MKLSKSRLRRIIREELMNSSNPDIIVEGFINDLLDFLPVVGKKRQNQRQKRVESAVNLMKKHMHALVNAKSNAFGASKGVMKLDKYGIEFNLKDWMRENGFEDIVEYETQVGDRFWERFVTTVGKILVPYSFEELKTPLMLKWKTHESDDHNSGLNQAQPYELKKLYFKYLEQFEKENPDYYERFDNLDSHVRRRITGGDYDRRAHSRGYSSPAVNRRSTGGYDRSGHLKRGKTS